MTRGEIWTVSGTGYAAAAHSGVTATSGSTTWDG